MSASHKVLNLGKNTDSTGSVCDHNCYLSHPSDHLAFLFLTNVERTVSPRPLDCSLLRKELSLVLHGWKCQGGRKQSSNVTEIAISLMDSVQNTLC
jgi:hypothetical protein